MQKLNTDTNTIYRKEKYKEKKYFAPNTKMMFPANDKNVLSHLEFFSLQYQLFNHWIVKIHIANFSQVIQFYQMRV